MASFSPSFWFYCLFCTFGFAPNFCNRKQYSGSLINKHGDSVEATIFSSSSTPKINLKVSRALKWNASNKKKKHVNLAKLQLHCEDAREFVSLIFHSLFRCNFNLATLYNCFLLGYSGNMLRAWLKNNTSVISNSSCLNVAGNSLFE